MKQPAALSAPFCALLVIAATLWAEDDDRTRLHDTFYLDGEKVTYVLVLRQDRTFALTAPDGRVVNGRYAVTEEELGLKSANLRRHFHYYIDGKKLTLRPTEHDAAGAGDALGEMPPTQPGSKAQLLNERQWVKLGRSTVRPQPAGAATPQDPKTTPATATTSTHTTPRPIADAARPDTVKASSTRQLPTDVRPDASPDQARSERRIEPLKLKAELPPLKLRPALDINKLTVAQYNGEVSAAMEAMRLVQEPMSATETKEFEAKWAPLFDFPTPQAVAYFNKLNPLLDEFLMLRGVIVATAVALDQAGMEAQYAAAYESEAGTREAMSIIVGQLDLLKCAQSRLAIVVEMIRSLGDPPNALEAKARARKKHQQALAAAKPTVEVQTDPKVVVSWADVPESWHERISACYLWQSNLSEQPIEPLKNHVVGFGRLNPEDRFHYLQPQPPAAGAALKGSRESSVGAHMAVELLWAGKHGSDVGLRGGCDILVWMVCMKLASPEDFAKRRQQVLGPDYVIRSSSASFNGYPAFRLQISKGGKLDASQGYMAEQYAVDVGLANQDLWVFVTFGMTYSYQFDPGNASYLARFLERWQAQRDVWLREAGAILSSLRFEVRPALPAAETARIRALANSIKQVRSAKENEAYWVKRRNNGRWVRDPKEPRVSVTRPEAKPVVRAGSATTLSGTDTQFAHSWTEPPPIINAGEKITIALSTKFLQGPKHATGTASTGLTFSGSCSVDGEQQDIETESVSRQKGNSSKSLTKTFPTPWLNIEDEISVGIGLRNGTSQAGISAAVVYKYRWEFDLLDPESPGIAGGPLPNVPWLADPKLTAQVDEQKAKAQAIEEHEHNIRLIEAHLLHYQQELAGEQNTVRAAELEARIRSAKADVQAEKDLIASLQTGQLVHTRTEWDEFAHAQFVGNIRNEQRVLGGIIKIMERAERLVAILPPAEAEKLRPFVRRQLSSELIAKMELNKARKVLQLIGGEVQNYYQGQSARQDEKAAWAGFGLEAAENIKSAADTGMMITSLFGGQAINLAYQASTGYAEGGATKAIKNAATTYSDAIDYAVTAYEGYTRKVDGKEVGLSGALQDLAIKYVQSKAMQWVAGKLTGAKPDADQRPPTVQEQFEAAKFKQERQWGEALVKDFQRCQADIQAAGHRGEAPEVLARLQAAARDKAAAIASSLHAKNYLKYKCDGYTGRAYDAHMRAIHAEVDAGMCQDMGRRGWNVNDWEVREFRNESSYGRPNMDRDVGLRERPLWELDDNGCPRKGADGHPIPNPERWETIDGKLVLRPQVTKNGKPMTLNQWQAEAAAAYQQAYRRVTGRSAHMAMEGITTSAHPEAYKDMAWLGSDRSRVSAAWGAQAADVTRYKVGAPGHADPHASYFTKMQEVARGTSKDMETKLLPLLENAVPKGSTPEALQRNTQALEEARRHWRKLNSVLAAFGKNDIDPIYAHRRIRELTGGKSIPEVVDEMGVLMEAVLKLGR